MFKLEKELVKALSGRMFYILLVGAVVLSGWIRFVWLPIEGADMGQFFLPWCETLKTEGFSAIAQGVGIYSVPLQLILWVSAVLPLNTVTAIKLFSILFDYLLAFGVALIVMQLRGKDSPRTLEYAMVAFAGTCLLPLVMLNSSFWGQSEAIYACFAIYAVWLLLREKWLAAFLLYALSFSVKLQAVLLLPLFVIVYFVRRKFSAILFLIIPAVVFVTSLPAVLVGANPMVGLNIYLGQLGYDQAYYLNYPGLPTITNNGYVGKFIVVSTGLALLVCLAMLTWLLIKRLDLPPPQLIAMAAWSAIACVVLLPGMHERYGYMGEILLWTMFFAKPSLRRFVTAVVFNFTGYCAYASFIFGYWPISENTAAIINLLFLAWYTYDLLRSLPTKKPAGSLAAGGKKTVKAATQAAAPLPGNAQPEQAVQGSESDAPLAQQTKPLREGTPYGT